MLLILAMTALIVFGLYVTHKTRSVQKEYWFDVKENQVLSINIKTDKYTKQDLDVIEKSRFVKLN